MSQCMVTTCEGRLSLGPCLAGHDTPGELLALLGHHSRPPPLGVWGGAPGHGGRVTDLSQTHSRLRGQRHASPQTPEPSLLLTVVLLVTQVNVADVQQGGVTGLVVSAGVRQLLLQRRHEDMQQLVSVLLLQIDDPAVRPQTGDQVAGIVGIRHSGAHVVQDLHNLHQRLGDRSEFPGPPVVDGTVLHVQPVVEGVAGREGLQHAVDEAAVAGVDQSDHGPRFLLAGRQGRSEQYVETSHHRPAESQAAQVTGHQLGERHLTGHGSPPHLNSLNHVKNVICNFGINCNF